MYSLCLITCVIIMLSDTLKSPINYYAHCLHKKWRKSTIKLNPVIYACRANMKKALEWENVSLHMGKQE